MPKFAAFIGAKFFCQAGCPSQPCVIESPRNSTSTSPFLAISRNFLWRATSRFRDVVAGFVFSPAPVAVSASNMLATASRPLADAFIIAGPFGNRETKVFVRQADRAIRNDESIYERRRRP